MNLWIKTHPIIRILFSNYTWLVPNKHQKVWLTFDDGPIPEVTEWVLDQLRQYNIKATFFCIGNNIEKYPGIFNKVISDGHAIGNHTFDHLNGWKTATEAYIANAKRCEAAIAKHAATGNFRPALFRPPYGKIKKSQAKILRKSGYKIIMWDVLSADFDQQLTPEQCLRNVLSNVEAGSIIVFHDSIKAFKNLEYVLPKTLAFLNQNGYQCEVLV